MNPEVVFIKKLIKHLGCSLQEAYGVKNGAKTIAIIKRQYVRFVISGVCSEKEFATIITQLLALKEPLSTKNIRSSF